MGNGSLYKTDRGLRATYLQNASHFTYFPSSTVALIIERPSVMSSTADQKVSRKPVHLPGSIVAREASVHNFFMLSSSETSVRLGERDGRSDMMFSTLLKKSC